MNQSYINKGMRVNNVLTTNALQITGDSVVAGSTTAKSMLNVYGNTQVEAGLNLQSSALFSQGFSSSSSLNVNNNSISNVNSSANANLTNLNTFNENKTQFYFYQSVVGYFWLDVGSQYPWENIATSAAFSSPSYSNYFNISGTNIYLKKAGVYTVSVYITKNGELGNGYGGHLELSLTTGSATYTLGWIYMWNEGGQSLPGALVDVSFPITDNNTGVLNLALTDQGGFAVQYFGFSVIWAPIT